MVQGLGSRVVAGWVRWSPLRRGQMDSEIYQQPPSSLAQACPAVVVVASMPGLTDKTSMLGVTDKAALLLTGQHLDERGPMAFRTGGLLDVSNSESHGRSMPTLRISHSAYLCVMLVGLF